MILLAGGSGPAYLVQSVQDSSRIGRGWDGGSGASRACDGKPGFSVEHGVLDVFDQMNGGECGVGRPWRRLVTDVMRATIRPPVVVGIDVLVWNG